MGKKNNAPARSRAEKIVLYLLYALWFAFNLYLCIKHEPYRDEAQSWLIAKDNDILGMIGSMWQEGHSWLFHLILYPFAHLGFPFAYVKYIGFAFAAAAMLLYVSKAPFKTPVICVTMFLPFINYYAGAFARPYAVMLLGAVLTGMAWKSREIHPVRLVLALCLFACSHIACVPASIILFIYFAVQRLRRANRPICETVVFTLLLAVFYAPLIPQAVIMLDKLGISPWIFAVAGCAGIALMVLGTMVAGRKQREEIPERRFCTKSVAMALFVAATELLSIAFMTSLTDAAIFTVKHFLSVVPAIIMCLWIVAEERIELYGARNCTKGAVLVSGVLAAICFLSMLIGLYDQMTADISKPYSEAEETAQYINENIPDNAVILAGHQGIDTTVVVYLDDKHKITVPQTGTELRYTKWCEEWVAEVPEEEWVELLEEYTEKNGEVYLLVPSCSDFVGIWSWLGTDDPMQRHISIRLLYDTGVFSGESPVDEDEAYAILKFTENDICGGS